ncbi:laccase [Pterulicium gracile]|uniref:Laccase n=1 Tax=Pterulicium gracile TaxID=1884261 RepID=A0A5C3QPK9_9AGAR|nr:laccase [Pterula gracilis]
MPAASTTLFFATLAGCLPAVMAAIGPVADLRVLNVNVNPDGFRRRAASAGGAVTGPLIVGNRNDNFRINVINELSDPSMWQTTSIHWHGFFQRGTSYSDGPAFITQCPISKGHSFVYNWNAENQAGTFWYHSHLQAQYCDGLRGPLVVYNPQDPHRNLYDVDNEGTVITLADWYHEASRPLLKDDPLPRFDSTLINGLGRWKDLKQKTPLSVINVEKGKRYRIRLVSISCDPNYVFQIDKHTELTIIEVDSVDHKPLVVDSIQIFAGQRYSFVLNANQPVNNYWIRANPERGDKDFKNGINSAILRYVGAPDRDPTTAQDRITKPLRERDLSPLSNEPAPGNPTPGGADVNIHLEFSRSGDKFFINGKSFESPDIAVLLQILAGNRDALSLVPEGTVISLPRNKTIEISMDGGLSQGPHPIHLHGHTFHVVRSAGSSTYNYQNPVMRDVVNSGESNDRVTFRFVTDNPGPWILHCHIDWHLVGGFEMLFVEDLPGIPAATQNPPEDWKQLCPIYHSQSAADL